MLNSRAIGKSNSRKRAMTFVNHPDFFQLPEFCLLGFVT